MNFLLTDYIYPLSEAFPLSGKLKMYLDNPRTEEEIKAVTEYVRQAYSVESAFQLSEKDIADALNNFLGQYSLVDSYIASFYKSYGQTHSYEILARMWIVARYENEEESEENAHKQGGLIDTKKLEFLLSDEDNPSLRRLIEYIHLLSLLVHTIEEFYEGRSFILDYDAGWYNDIKPNRHVCIIFFTFVMFASEPEVAETDDSRWLFFPSVKDTLATAVNLLDSAMEKNLGEKIFYIASLLNVAAQNIKDDKIKVGALVSLIELLVTHNPDFNRFNIEDSINKQFQLKVATLVYLNDKSKNVNQVKRRLKEIYALRSAIAHGNFREIGKHFEGAKKQGENYPFAAVIVEIYSYLRAIIWEYLKDSGFVEFLKDN